MICIFGVGLFLSVRTNFSADPQIPVCDSHDDWTNVPQKKCFRWSNDAVSGGLYGARSNGWYRKYRRCGRGIAIGGPGAVFWMWISAPLGMCTKYAEVTLAVHFREKNTNGELVGGPMCYT